jgi:Holliday junction resolvase
MANTDIGKQFEARWLTDWKRCFPRAFVFRLHDQMTGYKETSQNPCDFLAFEGRCVLMVECKAHKGASINFNDIRQYDKMLDFKGLYKTFPGVVVWFYEKDIVIWVSIEEMEKMVNDGEKSIGLRMIDKKKPYKKSYIIHELPSKKLRTFMETDYNYLVEVLNG